jgi:hypothetical protein
MALNNQMMIKNKNMWNKNVRLIALSIDESAKQIQEHVTKKRWLGIEHY